MWHDALSRKPCTFEHRDLLSHNPSPSDPYLTDTGSSTCHLLSGWGPTPPPGSSGTVLGSPHVPASTFLDMWRLARIVARVAECKLSIDLQQKFHGEARNSPNLSKRDRAIANGIWTQVPRLYKANVSPHLRERALSIPRFVTPTATPRRDYTSAYCTCLVLSAASIPPCPSPRMSRMTGNKSWSSPSLPPDHALAPVQTSALVYSTRYRTRTRDTFYSGYLDWNRYTENFTRLALPTYITRNLERMDH
ncbi:hypothetical protein Bbelb_197000 [Branchiostoma belcheri]|nr:hypothetical protein Bbelb_197000 [Branchiostoma belcheri]